ncbi:cytochrome-c peroxidase [Polaribacter sp. AHE13PA]|uniref:cytochrome-c peroxidase n=1 Tax=Polaribacter sp. AHE13PA TaxID=2745562 RepID=UPI001C4E6313|nr:cytochrome c peroxidase [Polaribacter sp. AHE13PA]QXP68259.1 cytochrome-c peroxidase [Polaribacter sp. AHE13PA]
MKKISILCILLFSCFFILSGKKTTVYKTDSILKNIVFDYTKNFYKFQKEVNLLDALTNKKAPLKDIKSQVRNTRLAYKKIEFIFDYYQTFYNTTYINGAPLPKISEYFEATKVIKPNGLQALDEAIFEENSLENKQHIKKLANKLKERVDFLLKSHLPIQLKSSQIIESIRSGMVRIFTLGITGYDTPGSVNGLEESLVSLQSMKTAFLHYNEGINPNAIIKFHHIKRLFEKGENSLKLENNFNEFDRMLFLKEVVNPLYGNLLEFQNLNNITLEPYKKHAQNYKVKNIFDANFINSDFYSELVYLPLDNKKTIKLGKLLFNDPQLSNSGKMSCLTCHDPNKGFADGLPKSISNKKGGFGARNAPTILNAGYSTGYFLDMRASNLETQVAHVIDNPLEFNTTFNAIINKLNKDPKYLALFKDAYKGITKQNINQRSISNAIAAYVNSLKSFKSPFDRYVRNETTKYPENAKRGFNLFMGKGTCATCHFAPIFNGTTPPFYLESESEVLGITQGFDSINPKLDTDLGRYNNGLIGDKQPYFKNSFKTVSIRNADLTAPYMHNGLFYTLEDVLEFYNLGGGEGMGIKVKNQTLSNVHLNLSKQEINDIIAFIKTLSDTSNFTTNKS